MKIYLLPLSLCLLFPLNSQAKEKGNNAEQQGKQPPYDRNLHYQTNYAAQLENPSQKAPPQETSLTQPTDQVTTYLGTPARPPLRNALDIWVMGDALLWQATEENLTYVYETDPTQSFNDFHTVDFGWNFGFRVAMGYNTPKDGWDLSLLWTHIENNAHDSERGDALSPAWGINNLAVPNPLKKAKAKWTIHLDQVDLGLGKEYYIGKHLTLRPFAGLRGDWIFQEYDVKYTPVSNTLPSENLQMDNRYFGFGFFGGFDSDWMLGCGWSIYSMADFAILMGFFDVDQKGNENNGAAPSKGKIENSFRCGRSILDLTLGLKWCHLFSKNSWGLTLKAGYEYHLYFDQNAFSNVAANNARVLSKPEGDLIYQGPSLSFQIDF